MSELPPTIEWRDGVVRIIDQRKLPETLEFLDCKTVDELCEAIASLAVRGAPALGAAGALGVALAAYAHDDASMVESESLRIATTRPTAVNLNWGVQRALAAYTTGSARGALDAAMQICIDDVAANRLIGQHGADLLLARDGGTRILTHCNAGHLATVGYGTAVGVVRSAWDRGLIAHVFVDETRPLLQGSRLTAWEFQQLGIPATVIVDSAAAALMAAGVIDAVIVGADRIAANGDVANKIGTYSLAVLARYHGIPMFVAAPISTVDMAVATGADIEIEDRHTDEITQFNARRLTPHNAAVLNRAFDVTPAALVTAIVTERGSTLPAQLHALM